MYVFTVGGISWSSARKPAHALVVSWLCGKANASSPGVVRTPNDSTTVLLSAQADTRTKALAGREKRREREYVCEESVREPPLNPGSTAVRQELESCSEFSAEDPK